MQYTVYNVMMKPECDVVSLYQKIPLTSLSAKIIEGEEILAIEHLSSPNSEKLEIRLTFKDKATHVAWVERNQPAYDNHVNMLHNFFSKNGITYERYTTDDFYISEFQGKSFLDIQNLLPWQLEPFDKQLIIDHLLPLGFFRIYQGFGNWEINNYGGARFLKEQQSGLRRIGNSPAAYKDNNYPWWLMAYSIDHAVDIFIGHKHDLFCKLKKLCYDVDELAEKYFTSCNYAAAIVGHKSLGDTFTRHSHRLHDQNKPTVTMCVRLTDYDEKDAVLQIWPPFEDDDPNLPMYYISPEKILETTQFVEPTNISLDTKISLFVFNASFSCHNVIWNDDIYMFFIFDHVVFRQGVREEIEKYSCISKHAERGRDKQLMFCKI